MLSYLKCFSFVAFVFMLASCSQKTAAPTTTQSTSSNEQANRRGGARKGERPLFADLLTKMDANKDGKLALAEVEGPLKDSFPQIDKDQDGFITEEEFKNAPRPGRRRGGRN